jgi:hypothetical protein
MPEANCSIYDYGTSRKHVGVSIFQIPKKDEDLSTKTREALVRLVTKARQMQINEIKSLNEQFTFVKDTLKNIWSRHVSSFLITN